MRRNSVTIVLLACCTAGAAQAADPLSSSYWEAAYLNSEIESVDNTTTPGTAGVTQDEVEGFRLAARIGLMPYLNFVGDYDQRRHGGLRDAFGSVGLGVHTTDPVYQFFGNATWERQELDSNADSSADRDEEGYGVEVGARYALQNMALHASYKHLDFGEVGSDEVTGAQYGGGLALQLSPWWALTADYRVRDFDIEDTGGAGTDTQEYSEWSVGFRRYFPTDSDPRKRKDGVLVGGEDDAGY